MLQNTVLMVGETITNTPVRKMKRKKYKMEELDIKSGSLEGKNRGK